MKRILTLLASLALVASGLHMLPAMAAEDEPTPVPEAANIEDVAGDANALNDQGAGQGIGDNSGGVNFANADILKVWFTNDSDKLNVHVQTTVVPPNSRFGLLYRIFFTEVEGCDLFEAYIPSITYAGTESATLVCDEDVAGELKIEALDDETGVTTLSFNRADSPVFATGTVLAAPEAFTRGAHGTDGGALLVPVFDTTKTGTDYVITEGGVGPSETPPGKNDPPGKKKGCTKGKGKKRGCEGKGKKSPKTGKPGAACTSFTPGEAGKEKPTVTVTDAATEDKPLEQTVVLDASVADATQGLTASSHDAFNFVIDSNSPDAGLYALIEFPARNDYDLNMMYTDGSYAARSHAWNTVIELNDTPLPPVFPNGISKTGHGGASTATSEKLVGIKVDDCSGWTMDVANYLGQGGEMTVKLWLGDANIDPKAKGEEPSA